MDRVKEALKCSDNEWKVLGPKVDRIMTLSRDADSGRGRMFRGGGRGTGGGPQMGGGPAGDRGGRPANGRGGGPGAGATSPVAKAVDDLQTTLDNPQATSDQIMAKLAALRAARDKAQKELAKARQDLRQLVTQRQEAQLVLMGILE